VSEDGNRLLNTDFGQLINGLVAGQTYELSFYQAASQQQGQLGPTTEQWQVSLGAQTQTSSLMNLPGPPGAAPDFAPWNQQTLIFTASAASEMLTFLALGTGAPPIALLDGVSLNATPEPSCLLLIGAGLVGLAAVYRRRKRV
jgi:PEP-CTERM motif